jgi:hypothetical protein
MGVRRPSKHLISTYVVRRKTGKFDAHVVDGRTKKEGRCVKTEIDRAISCSRDKALS